MLGAGISMELQVEFAAMLTLRWRLGRRTFIGPRDQQMWKEREGSNRLWEKLSCEAVTRLKLTLQGVLKLGWLF